MFSCHSDIFLLPFKLIVSSNEKNEDNIFNAEEYQRAKNTRGRKNMATYAETWNQTAFNKRQVEQEEKKL